MDAQTYDQESVSADLFGTRAAFLAEGAEVSLASAGGEVVTGIFHLSPRFYKGTCVDHCTVLISKW